MTQLSNNRIFTIIMKSKAASATLEWQVCRPTVDDG